MRDRRFVVGCLLSLALVLQGTAGARTSVGEGEGEANGEVRARVAVRNDLGVNPLTLGAARPPRLGVRWESTLDCSAHAGGVAVLSARSAPFYGVVVDAGEILIDVFSGAHLFTRVRPHGGAAVTFATPIPDDPALLGFEAHVQGLCTGEPGARLSNALALVLGR